jgi:hypothetical protein
VSLGFGRSATQHLTRARLDLMPRRAVRRWLLRSTLVVVAFVAGAGAGVVARDAMPTLVPTPMPPAPVGVDASAEIQPLKQQLDQARLALRLSSARSQELERQVDALNQRLRESTEELTFFRKAREGKHP